MATNLYLISEKIELLKNKSAIIVHNTLEALQKLAKWYRKELQIPLIAITGSNGKTITKDLLAHILASSKTIGKSPKSYNSQVGVPLSILALEENQEIAILEAGISEKGEMAKLELMLSPNIGIITNIGTSHIGTLLSLEITYKEKIELFKNFDDNNILIYNIDDIYLKDIPNIINTSYYTYGLSPEADLRAIDIRLENEGISFLLKSISYNFPERLFLKMLGKHNVYNALASISASLILEITEQIISERLRTFVPSLMRLEISTTENGITFINDAYNADPVSVKSALETLKQYSKGHRKIVILGDMLQLGTRTEEEHKKIANYIIKEDISYLITIGKYSLITAQEVLKLGNSKINISSFNSNDEIANKLEKILHSGDMVLFKGSRSLRLENILKQLLASLSPTRLLINLDAIAYNIHQIRKYITSNVGIMAMVKSFGYGTDAIAISHLAEESGINYLAVAIPDEALQLRNNGIEMPILIMNLFPDEADKILHYNLTAAVSSIEQLKELIYEANKRNKKAKIHINIDTGFGRFGIPYNDAIPFIIDISKNTFLELEGIMTHFSCADMLDGEEHTKTQYKRFDTLIKCLEEKNISFPIIHSANTAAIFRFPETHYNMVRPGLCLYGLYPSELIKQYVQLLPSIKWESRITFIKELPTNYPIGYGATYTASKPITIAIIPVGYNDGYPRFLSNRGEVLIRGKRFKVIGRISMDSFAIDISDLDDAKIGEKVILFGEQGDDEISIDDIARIGNTINYEILCKISMRVKRVFYRGD